MSKQRRTSWRTYLEAEKGPFWAAELFDRPNWIERAWIRIFG